MIPHIPKIVAVHPVVIITGFLGAGKTTLLRELLSELQEKSISCDVILNDYEDASIDSSTLAEFAKNVEPLTATCACCEGLDFLLELAIQSRKSASDLLFIELNGTADPVPIIESFTLLEDKLRLNPRWQICVIDVRNFGNRQAYQDIEELQLQTASHIYFSHVTDDTELGAIQKRIKHINPHASIVDKPSLTTALTALAHRTRAVLSSDPIKTKISNPAYLEKSPTHQKSHDFNSCQILMPDQMTEESIKAWLNSLPSEVIRVKLLIGVTSKPGARYLYERVGLEISKYTQRVILGDNVPNSAIIIGPNLDTHQLEQLTRQAVSPLP